MSIINSYIWTGALSSEWSDDNGTLSNWSLAFGTATQPSFPGFNQGDEATFQTSASVTADNGPANPEYLAIDEGTTVTFLSGHFEAGVDGVPLGLNGLTVFAGGTLIIASDATFVDPGGADYIGLAGLGGPGGDGLLAVQSGGGFRDSQLEVGVGASGKVTVDGATFEVTPSSLGASDGILWIGNESGGDGSVDISANSLFFAVTTVVGQDAGSTGELTLDASTWGGTTLSIAPIGDGTVTVRNGSSVALTDISIGGNAGTQGSLAILSGSSIILAGKMDVGQDAGASGALSVDAATLNVAGDLTIAPAGTDSATIANGSTVRLHSGLIIGDTDGSDGSLDISASTLSTGTTTIIGNNTGATGALTLDDSTWSGDGLTIGAAGNGNVTIDNGSSATLNNIIIGANGELDVSAAAGATTTVTVPSLTLAFGTLAVSGGGEVNVGGSGVQGAVDVAGTVVGLGTITGDIVIEQSGVVQADQPVDGRLTVNGNISGTGTIEPMRILEVNGGIGSGVTIQFSAPAVAGDGLLQLDVPRAEDGTITGFSVGNTIDIEGLVYDNAVFTPGTSGNPGVLTLSGSADAPLQLTVDGNYAPDSFVATPRTNDTLVTLGSSPPPPPDTLTGSNQSVASDQSVGVNSLFSISGPAPSRYQVWLVGPADGSVTDSSGAIAANTAVDETDLGSVNYIGGGAPGEDRLWLRTFDGQWSDWALVTLTDPGVARDTVTATNQSVAYQQSVALNNLFSISGPAPSRYQVWLDGPADGSVTDSSGAIAANTAVDETDLGSVNYIGGGAPGEDLLWLRTFDGQWSDWALVSLTDPGVARDTVTATNQSVAYQQSVALNNLFSISGPAPSRYQVWLDGPADGSVTDSSGAIAANTAVDETDLGSVNYIGGGAPGEDRLWLRTFDGQWSDWTLATLTDPGAVTATDQSVGYQQSVPLSSIFTVYGPAPSQYEIWLDGPSDGSITDGTSNTIVLEQNLGNASFVGGLMPGQDRLWVRADYGAGQTSNWVMATLTDAGVIPPTVLPLAEQQTVAPDTVIPAANLFSVSNNNAAITQYGFWDVGTGGGYFQVAGAAQGTNQEIDVAAAKLSDVDYVAGNGTDTLWVRANDGQWGNWSSAFTVTG